VIHALSDEQDMRRMGGIRSILPFSYSISLIGSFALIGFPFLAGFYSKDVILEVSFAKFTVISHFSFVLGLLAAFCTAFYSIRLLYLVFLSYPNGHKATIIGAHEGSWRMTLPLFLLCVLSIFVGFLSKEFFIGFGTSFWSSSLFVFPENYLLTDIEFLATKDKLLALLITIFGALCSFFLYEFKLFDYFSLKKNSSFFYSFYLFLNKKWYIDRIYNQIVSQNILNSSFHYYYKTIDRGIIEHVGPTGISSNLFNVYSKFKIIQTGMVEDYLTYMFLFSIFVMLTSFYLH
jgi:NADH-ubiquinone oxidoreductase chain 5